MGERERVRDGRKRVEVGKQRELESAVRRDIVKKGNSQRSL